MRVVVLHPCTKFEVRMPCHLEDMAHDVFQHTALMGLVTLTFDLLTLKLVYQSHLRLGNLPSKFGHARPLGSRIIRYVRDGRTDGRTKATLAVPCPTGGGVIMTNISTDSSAYV